MSFVEPTKKFVRDPEYVKKLLDVTLEKDLLENEIVCPQCGGTGIVIYETHYGLDDDPEKKGLPNFRFKKQSLSFCPMCYNGVARICKYCGKPIMRSFNVCSCEGERLAKRREINKIEAKRMADAPIATEEQIAEKGGWYYSEYYSYNYGFFNDWEEFFDEWIEDPLDDRPEYVWLADPAEFHIDAKDTVYHALENMYDDASVDSAKIQELQGILDKWCEETGVGPTYYQGRYKVRIPWEEYDEAAEQH